MAYSPPCTAKKKKNEKMWEQERDRPEHSEADQLRIGRKTSTADDKCAPRVHNETDTSSWRRAHRGDGSPKVETDLGKNSDLNGRGCSQRHVCQQGAGRSEKERQRREREDRERREKRGKREAKEREEKRRERGERRERKEGEEDREREERKKRAKRAERAERAARAERAGRAERAEREEK